MQIKSTLLVAAAAVASASAYTVAPQHGFQQGQGMTQANEYAVRNMDEVCISTRPVNMCEEGYVVKSFKNEKVNFHCESRNSVKGQRYIQQVENNEVIPEMTGKQVHIQGRVQVPTKCVAREQVNGQEARRRQHQQQHGQRVQLIEDQQEFDQENQWDQEEDQLTNEEQYNQYRKNRFSEEKQWQKMQSLFQQYPELTQKKLHQIVKADEGKYQQVAEQLKELVNQKQVTSHLMPQIHTTLPTYFSEVAKQLYEAMQEQNQQNKQHQRGQSMEQLQEQQQYRLDQLVGTYQQYTDLMKRVYVYIVKEALKLNQESPRRLANTPELIRKVWEKTRQELTKSQIEKADQILEQVQELLELDQTNQLIVDELVSEQLKTSSKQARRNLMRIIVSGLMMENSPIFEQHY